MSKLIALVATAVFIDGARTVIPAGEPLPDSVSEHDRKELQDLGAAADPKTIERKERALAREAEAGNEAFQREREAVQQAHASIQPAAAPAVDPSAGGTGTQSGTKPPATKTTAAAKTGTKR